MKTKMKISAISVALTLIVSTVALSVSVSGQRSRSDHETSDAQWEYLIVSGGNVNLTSMSGDQFSNIRKQPDGSFGREAFALERNFDKLGAKGWELVAVYGSPNDPIFYFKRPKETK